MPKKKEVAVEAPKELKVAKIEIDFKREDLNALVAKVNEIIENI